MTNPTANPADFTATPADFFESCIQRVNQALDQLLPSSSAEPTQLHQAMRYSTLNEGKRLRPLLVYATGISFGAKLERLDHAASAVECIHAYSLIHDDLPAMDDDDFRRGKPSCHKAFDEATAILAGDALQALAFELIARDKNLTPDQQVAMLASLAEAVGSQGMVGGQVLDLAIKTSTALPSNLENIHLKKTAALIQASVHLGAIAAGVKDAQCLSLLKAYAQNLGLAFQFQDDIQDKTFEGQGLSTLQTHLNTAFAKAMTALQQCDISQAHLKYLSERIIVLT